MFKKITCFIMAVLVIVPFMSMGNQSVAADDTMTTLVSLVEKFPNGKYWNNVGKDKNNSDGVTSTPCTNHRGCTWNKTCDCNNFDNAIQCMGYAHKIAYEITGVKPRNNFVKVSSLKASALRVGDIIRYRWNGHSLCVTGVSGNKISFTDCNWVGKCQIRWGIMDISDIEGFSYVYRLEGNNRKNTDLDFYKNADRVTDKDEAVVDIGKNDPHEEWKMVNANLNVRAEHSTDSNVVGKIYDGSTFKVYDKYDDGTYLWGKILYENTVGWCALNYSEYLGGEIEIPYMKNTASLYAAGDKISLSWSECCGTGKYVLYVYDDFGDVYDKFSLSENKRSKSFTIDDAGIYTARVYAVNSIVPDWKISGGDYIFEVAYPEDVVFVESLKLSAPEKLAKGDSTTIEAAVKPEDATDKTLLWKSSDTSVATVNSKGKVTAKKYGTVKITCTAADSGEVKKSVTITVVPDKVSGLRQDYSTVGKFSLSWKKVSGASYYSIYRYDSDSEKFKRVATTEDTSYTFKLTAGRSYKFKVYAVNKSGSETYSSEPSQTVTGVTGPKATELTVKMSGTKAKLSWDKVSGATHYVIYRVSGDELIKLETVDADNLSYTVEDLKANAVYRFKVRSIRKDDGVTGYGAYSNVAKT